MANLLTSETKQNLQSDLLGRKLVGASLALGLLLIIILVILGSFWTSLFIRKSGLASLSSTTNKELKEFPVTNDPVSLLKKIEAEVKIVNNYWSEPLISTLVTKTITLKPAGLKILGFVVERGEAGQPTKLSLVGLVDNRSGLVNYVNLLRQDKFFSRVDLPVESLISDQGGQFVINLEK